MHTDAVQGAGWLDLPRAAGAADLVSISAHKLGGPKGVGALLVRPPAGRLRPVLRGGPQERSFAAGTHDVAGIVGMGCAARKLPRSDPEEPARVARLGDRLTAGVLSAVEGSAAAVPAEGRVSAICNIGFEGVVAEELLLMLDSVGICASAGSSCASGALEPSHVLIAMGRSTDEARRHVRFSLGHDTTESDVDRAVLLIAESVAKLRTR